jgi:hypothetical protein
MVRAELIQREFTTQGSILLEALCHRYPDAQKVQSPYPISKK